MENTGLKEMVKLARRPEAVAATKAYLEDRVRVFLRRNERVLICLPSKGDGSLAQLLEEVVTNAGGIPILWGPDYRWKGLLRQAFESRATVIVGPPLMVLGLTKLARASGTPLFIRNVLTAGGPCLEWMEDGIHRGLDCQTWGCFNPGSEELIAGFSCDASQGVHLRDDVYRIEAVDEHGVPLPDGMIGDLILISQEEPELRMHTGSRGRILRTPCDCGAMESRVVDISRCYGPDEDLAELGAQILSMSSVLDCSLHKGLRGLEMELVVFPGETLPHLPSCAKRLVRCWDPDTDAPTGAAPNFTSAAFYGENH